MINIDLFVCAEGVSIDQRTNNLSIFSIFKEIVSVGFPFIFPRLTVVTMLQRDAEDPDPQAELRIAHDGKEIFMGPIPVKFQNKPVTRFLFEVGGLALPNPGELEFQIYLDGKKQATYDVMVKPPSGPIIQQPETKASSAKTNGSDGVGQAGAPSSE